MDHILKHLHQTFRQKKLTKHSAGAFILHLLKKELHYPAEVTGKLVGETFTIRTVDKEDKTALFHKRVQLMSTINKKLSGAGYQNKVSKIKIL